MIIKKESTFLKIKNYIISLFIKLNKLIDKRQKICIISGITISILCLLSSPTIFINKYEIKRNTYGKPNEQYTITAYGHHNEKQDITFQVSARQYTKEEADKMFDTLFAQIGNYILLNNTSFEDIRTDLNFNEYFSNEGIYANYLFKLDSKYNENEYEKFHKLITSDGKIHNNILANDEEIEGIIKIVYSCYVKNEEIKYSSKPYILPIKIKPKLLDIKDKFKIDLLNEISKIDSQTVDNSTITLPTSLNSNKIYYTEKIDWTFLIILFISLLIAILLPLKDKSNKDNKIKLRNKLLTKEYYSFVTKLTIFIGAGETIKNALERISQNYKKNKNNSCSILYNEIDIVIRKMKNGITEDIALSDLSNKIGLRQYTKLFNILEQNRKNGSNDIRTALSIELSDAFQERKMNAKILGEEAQTKLIIPLIMMLSIVLIIIIVPAITGI